MFFKDTSFPNAIERISKLCYNTAEIWGWENLNLYEAKNACDEYGVRLISMCTSEFRMTDPKFRNLWLEGLEKSCKAALKVGADRLITQVGQDTGAERQYQHEAIVETLRLARPILEKYGITVMLEPLNTYVNHPGYYLTSSKEAFGIVREAESPFVKVVYDIYHQQITEGNIIPSITENLDCIAHLHAAGHPGRIEPWLGESDYSVIFDAVTKAGYNGFCGLEYHPTLDPEVSLAEAKRRYGA